ncbi:MAG: ferredoxin-type protein NapF [Pseudomonadales bacterium]
MTDTARRRFFTRRNEHWQALPWLAAPAQFHDNCSRCNACVEKCEEQIIVRGEAGFPTLDFKRGECTFCYACAQACEEQLFTPRDEAPWQQVAHIADNCLAQQGITCRSCEDFCEPQAIVFKPRLGGPALPSVDSDDCTGCGACIAPCASASISFTHLESL